MDEEFLNHIDEFHKSQLKAESLLKDNYLICECNCINVGNIRDFFNEESQFSIEKMKDSLNAGSGCGQCLANKEDWFKKIF